MNQEIGVFLSRMQPLHIGHIGMIKKALSENDKVIILIGSSNKEGTIRNPINACVREEILAEVIQEEFTKEEREKIICKKLPDWSEETDIASNLEWGRYLYYNVVSISRQKTFSMYFSDEPNMIENWFQDPVIRKRIKLKLFKREDMFEAVSSTKIRKAFETDDRSYIEKSVPSAVIKRYAKIQEILKSSK